MQMSTVAEGIETLEQLQAVSIAGCEEVQGFYFSRPVPESEVQSALAQCQMIFDEGHKKRVAG